MEIRWLLRSIDTVPAGDDWLGPDERSAQARFKIAKRRAEWRLGRFTAKRLLAVMVGVDSLDRLQVIAAKDGAPEAFVDGRPVSVSMSISHRAGVAACVAAGSATVGCDLEAIEPRSVRFVQDFFTEREREATEQFDGRLRDRFVALTWSAKESALKVLRAGLRRDTRSVEVEVFDVDASSGAWCPVTARISPENEQLSGWWRAHGDLVFTVVSDDPVSRIARHDEQR